MLALLIVTKNEVLSLSTWKLSLQSWEDRFPSVWRLQYSVWFTRSWMQERPVSWGMWGAAERSARPQMEIWQANGSRPAAETDGDQPREKCAAICQSKRHEKTWGPRGKTLFHWRCFQSVSERHVREVWGRFCSFKLHVYALKPHWHASGSVITHSSCAAKLCSNTNISFVLRWNILNIIRQWGLNRFFNCCRNWGQSENKKLHLWGVHS